MSVSAHEQRVFENFTEFGSVGFGGEWTAEQDCYLQMEFELRDRNVACQFCGIKAIAPEKNLRAAGWWLNRDGHTLCPHCDGQAVVNGFAEDRL